MSGTLPLVVALGDVDGAVVAPILKPHARWVAEPSESDLIEAVGAIVRAHVVVDAAALDSMPALRVIARTGVGTEKVDVAEATRRGIPVIITPGSNTHAVAEGALAHLLTLTKALPPLTSLVRDDEWSTRSQVTVGDLDGGVLAILGYGRIGRRVGELAQAFGMSVIAYDPYVSEADVRLASSVQDAVASATHISVHLPGTPETAGLISREIIESLTPGTILVNLARGEVVDLDALLWGLESGQLAGVGLDVFPEEPPVYHPLFDHKNVVLSPHVMGLTTQSTAETFRQAAAGIADFLAGNTPEHVATAKPEHSKERTMSTIRIAGAPISWGVCEVPGWGHQMGPDRVLTEMSALGLEAMEFGPLGFLPEDAEGRKATLAKHNMSAVGGFFPVVLHDPGFDPLPSIATELDAYVAADAEVLVLAAETGLEGYDAPRPEMAEENWQTVADNLTRINEHAAARGITVVIHPHAGTMVETKADVDEVLTRTTIPFCLDTGHMWIGGTDPVAFAKDHGDRVGHVHFKDVRLDIAQRVRDGELSYYDAVTQGLYTPLGKGDVDVRAITTTLISQGYSGWFVLEQDNVMREEPEADGGPRVDAKDSVEFLRAVAAEAAG